MYFVSFLHSLLTVRNGNFVVYSCFYTRYRAENRSFQRFAGCDRPKTNVFKINRTAAIYNGEQMKEIAGELFISTEERPVKLQEASL